MTGMSEREYTCDCDAEERRPYVVIGHDESRTICHYCDQCAELAAVDYNGETKSIAPMSAADLKMHKLMMSADAEDERIVRERDWA